MKVQVLGTVKAVTDREYTRKDGSQGIAHNVMLQVNDETLQGDIFTTGDEWTKMGCIPGTIGTMSIWLYNEHGVTKEGRNFTSNKWRFMDFKLANQGVVTTPSSAAPEEPAEAVDVDPEESPI